MHATAMLERVLEGVAATVGDPAPRVYEQLFARSPELLPLFVNDAGGAVRGEMFHRALDTLTDLAAGRPYAQGMIASERANHAMLGVSPQHFNAYFHAMGEVFRDALGAGWTDEINDAWQALLVQVDAIHAHSES